MSTFVYFVSMVTDLVSHSVIWMNFTNWSFAMDMWIRRVFDFRCGAPSWVMILGRVMLHCLQEFCMLKGCPWLMTLIMLAGDIYQLTNLGSRHDTKE